MVAINPDISSHVLEAHIVVSTSDIQKKVPSKIPSLDRYKIDRIHESEPSCIIFAHHSTTNEGIVLKLLIEYADSRYNLATIRERQHCQVEALYWNRIFTPDVYIGLVPIGKLDIDRKRLEIDEIIEYPTLDMLDSGKEYMLLMRPLPTSRRLDFILNEPEDSLEPLLQILIRYIGRIHTNLPALSLQNASRWGSCEWLQTKLAHNMAFLDQILTTSQDDRYQSYSFLKERLPKIFNQYKFQIHFNQRIWRQRIKRCHADIKAQNIWLAPLPVAPKNGHYINEPEKHIFLLDAIDFNPMYSNIDILSDLAMLLTDIQARTKSLPLVNRAIEDYLEITNQQDRGSRLVLAYYLVEKAIVGAAVNILFDNQPDIGLAFLEVAHDRMIDLENQMAKQ